MVSMWWRSGVTDEDEARCIDDALISAGLDRLGTRSYRVLEIAVKPDRVPDRVTVVAVRRRGHSVAAVVVGHASWMSYHDPHAWPICYLLVHGRKIRRARRWAKSVVAGLPVARHEDITSKRLFLRSLVRPGD